MWSGAHDSNIMRSAEEGEWGGEWGGGGGGGGGGGRRKDVSDSVPLHPENETRRACFPWRTY